MGLIEDFIAGAIGYGISEASKSHPLRDAINERFLVLRKLFIGTTGR
jgi:hypothetical protein